MESEIDEKCDNTVATQQVAGTIQWIKNRLFPSICFGFFVSEIFAYVLRAIYDW